MAVASTVRASGAPLVDSVFERLLADIVSGHYPAGTRLPAERELAREIGASRPTLREAMRRLSEWGLIEARRSSGVIVRSRRHWTFDVLPAYMRNGAPSGGSRALLVLLRDLLDVRRAVFVDVLRLVAPRLPPGSLGEARGAVARAWAARDDVSSFLREDFELIRAIAIAADFLPALWMLNSLARTYLELARTMTSPGLVPEDYIESYAAVLNALEKNEAESACKTMTRYLEAHDRRLLDALATLS